MNEQEIRAMVRESIARALGERRGETVQGSAPVPAHHASHFRYLLHKADGPCLIEPSVPCNKCGYCESHGH
jgi:hypothetical protein